MRCAHKLRQEDGHKGRACAGVEIVWRHRQCCTELLGIDLAIVHELAANVEPYLRADGTRIWSLMQLERQLRPAAYSRRRGGYLERRQTPGRQRQAKQAPVGLSELSP
jgi:hypothetical protein